MFFKDLSLYSYFGFELDNVYCVGWLSRRHRYARGHVPDDVLQKLIALAWSHPQQKTRGYHRCTLCPWPLGQLFIPKLTRNTGLLVLGSAEIWVPSVDGSCFYSAPNLIIHYIKRHWYCPPREFVEALERFEPHPGWKPHPLAKYSLPAVGSGKANADS